MEPCRHRHRFRRVLAALPLLAAVPGCPAATAPPAPLCFVNGCAPGLDAPAPHPTDAAETRRR